jgi:hypothetical protein
MGNCMYRNHRRNNSNNSNRRYMTTSYVPRDTLLSEQELNVPLGRNKRIKMDLLSKWKSDVSLNEIELDAKRKEFWETAAVFSGKSEIWDALKGALNAIENDNISLAQTIIDCAQITLPNGDISDCYDELGNRYQLPNYVINKPTNLRTSRSSSSTKSSNRSNSYKSIKKKLSKKQAFKKDKQKQFPIRLRLSSPTQTNFCELKLNVYSDDRILNIKKQISQLKQIDSCKQTMFFGGKRLNDKQKLSSIKLKKNFVVQVICKE